MLVKLTSLVSAAALAAWVGVVVGFLPVFAGEGATMILWGWITVPLGIAVGVLIFLRTYRMLTSSALLSIAQHGKKLSLLLVVHMFLLAGSLIGLQKLAHLGDVQVVWEEEVSLESGRIISLVRSASGNTFGNSRADPNAWLPEHWTLAFKQTGNLASPSEWRGAKKPLLVQFDQQTNRWLIVTWASECFAMYVFKDGKWQMAPLNENLSTHRRNLSSPKFEGQSEKVTAADKVALEKADTLGELRRDCWALRNPS